LRWLGRREGREEGFTKVGASLLLSLRVQKEEALARV
jgi:hypothetical protein